MVEADQDKAFRVAAYPDLEKNYAPHLKALINNCCGESALTADDRINFLYDFDQIVGGYKRRADDPNYFARMAECRTDLEIAAKSLNSAVDKLPQLDGYHWDAVRAGLEMSAPAKLLDDLDFIDLFLLLKRVATLSQALSFALEFAGNEDLQERGPGNVALPFLFQTIDLMRFWERWTGEKVDYAKAIPKKDKKSGKKNSKSGGQPGQRSTEFIRLALKLIHPAATAANAITSINRARKLIRLADDASAQPIDSRNQFLLSIAQSIADKKKSKSIRPKSAE